MASLAPLADAATVHVVQLTDPHLFADPQGSLFGLVTRDSLRCVVAQVQREQPDIDLLLCTGDLSQDGSDASYAAFKACTDVLGAPARWLPGNHDEALTLARVAPAQTVAVTDIGAWRVILLDSAVPGKAHGELADAQLALLDDALAGAGQRHCLIALHHPPVDIGCAWMQPIGLHAPEVLFARCARYPQVKAIVWGHVHQPWDSLHDGVRLLATPSTCIQFAPGCEEFTVSEESPGYRWLRLQPDGLVDTGVERLRDYQVRLDFASAGY